MSVAITRLDRDSFAAALDGLAALLVDAVDGGASVGFLPPLTHAKAATWWRTLADDVARGTLAVLAAHAEGRVVGTVQLRLAQWPNARHRAEVAKLLVHRDGRRRGIGRALMREVERVAHDERRTLLVLDTLSGSEAERLYEALGWSKAAAIPEYAMHEGTLRPTTIFFRTLK